MSLDHRDCKGAAAGAYVRRPCEVEGCNCPAVPSPDHTMCWAHAMRWCDLKRRYRDQFTSGKIK